MKKIGMLSALLCVVAGAIAVKAVAAEKQKKEGGDRLRVGVFDSRAIAIAYGNSEEFKRRLRDRTIEHDKAKAAGDEKRVKEIETEMENWQKLAHKQAFGTWPVDEFLDTVKGKIPDVAAAAKVDLIVSKWDVVFKASSAELVDVTEPLVKLFNPSERAMKWVRDLQNQEPIPIKKIEELDAKGEI